MLRKILLFLVLCFLCTHSAWAATRSWNVGEGDWNVAGNWTPNGLPAAVDTVYIGNNGTANMSGMTATVYYMDIGRPTGSGTLNLTGASTQLTVTGDSPVIGLTGTGILNILEGAVMRVNTSGPGYFCMGKENGTGITNISGANSLLYSGNFLHMGHFSGRGYFNITDGGSLVSATTLFVRDGYGTINVTNGTISATHIYNDGVSGILNVFGAGSTITSSSLYNHGGTLMDTNYYIDSTTAGTSAVNTTSATTNAINLSGKHRVTAWGFAAHDAGDTFEVFTGRSAASFFSSFSLADAPDLKIANAGINGHYTLGFADSTPVWDLDTQRVFTPASNRAYAGWVHVTGHQEWQIIAKFNFANAESSGLLDVFIGYLNNGMAASDEHFSLWALNERYVELTLPDNFLATTSLDTLGWGLLHLNETYGTNITLNALIHIPEPATWPLLLLGGGVLLCLRKKSFLTNNSPNP